MEKMICVEGNIGAGKSEVLKLLQKRGLKVKLEPTDKWTLLEKFYKDSNYAFSLQLQILTSYADANEDILYERSAFSALKVFSDLLHDSGQITKHQYDLLTLCTMDMIHKEPSLIIYLQLDEKECLQRIQKRNREGEDAITLEYLENISKKYEKFLKDMEDVEVKILNINVKDLTTEEVCDLILDYLK
jgi:deoxyadenosine/deoxycytidine kinase